MYIMGMKRFVALFLACAIAMGALSLTATAETGHYEDNALQMEDMKREMIDVSKVEVLEESSIRATGSLNSDIPANTLAVSDIKFSLEVGETVTINCSYSPASANMDFGVIAPDGYFYFLNVKGVSINQSIRVSQSGSYAVAVRNNSSHTVTVVGFITY